MKKSKKVLLSAAIAAAIMGSVSLPQVQAADIGSGVNLKATSTGIPFGGGYDVKTTDPNLNTTLATQEGLKNVNTATDKAQAAADKAQKTADSKVDQSTYNWDKAQTNAAVQETKDTLTTFQKEQDVNNKAQRKDIEQNKNDIKANASAANKAQAAADKAQKTADSKVDQAKYNWDKAQTNAAVQETKDNLTTFQKEQDVNNKAQRKDINQNKNDIKDIKDNMKDSLDKAAQATNKANSAANDAQVAADKATNNAQMASDAATDAINAADKANQAADNIKSDLDKKVDKTQYKKDKAFTNAAIQETKDNLTTFQKEQDVNNKAQRKDINQNKQDIKANASAINKAQATADGAQKDATKANDKADAALKVTGNGVLYNHATNLTDGVNQNKLAADKAQAAADKAQKTADANTDSINALDGRVTTNESNIAKNTTAIANETNDRVAADTVLSNRITENSSAIQSLRHDVSDLGTEIDNVGAISAALAGLHPLDWNGSGSKFQLSAAAGTYDGKQAMALGGFYHPNRNMLLSLGVSSSLGSDRKTAGNVGITFRVGKGSNGTVSDDVAERLAAMDQKISQLESQNQKLTSILAIVDPSLTKEFPDVPANHWAYEAVSKLAGNGIVEGYPDGDFHGDRTMTRYEMAQVIYKALKKGGSVDQKLVKEFNKEIEAVKANDAQ